MKIEITHGDKPAVTINHVVMYSYNNMIIISVDTKEKYPDWGTSTMIPAGDEPIYHSIHFYGPDQYADPKPPNRGRSSIDLIPETEEEIKLFDDCYSPTISSRYGPLIAFIPTIPKETEQIILYEDEVPCT